MRGRFKYALSVCLLMLYVAFQASITVFSHVHILNGEKLVHSHPYSNANHSHTTDQVITITRLSSFQTLEVNAASVNEIELSLLYTLEFDNSIFCIKAPHAHYVNLRAPPFC